MVALTRANHLVERGPYTVELVWLGRDRWEITLDGAKLGELIEDEHDEVFIAKWGDSGALLPQQTSANPWTALDGLLEMLAY